MQYAQTVSKPQGEIKCKYCRYRFVPEPVVNRKGKRKTAYIECPRCGNGLERPVRWYDIPNAKFIDRW